MEPTRCPWPGNDVLYQDYHDQEWGVPVKDDRKIFEFLTLETFQAGLSWITVLRKRDNFRKAFDNFDYEKIAGYDDAKYHSLIHDKGIIRNKLKIKAAINNAQVFMKVQKEFGSFSKYIWGFVNHKPIQNHYRSMSEIPATSTVSDQLSRDMKQRGFKFVGSTVIYAHMQATGMVNDHIVECFRYRDLTAQ